MVCGSQLPFPAGVVFLSEFYEVDKPAGADTWRLLCLGGFDVEEERGPVIALKYLTYSYFCRTSKSGKEVLLWV